MKKLIRMIEILALIVFYVSIVSAQKVGPPTNREKDEAAIKANLEQIKTGWNMKSGEALARPFTEDADFVVITGAHLKTRVVIAEQHQRLFDTIFKDVELLDYVVEQIRFLRPDVALVHALGRRTDTADKTKTVSGRISLVMLKNKGKWQIAAFHNTQLQEQ